MLGVSKLTASNPRPLTWTAPAGTCQQAAITEMLGILDCASGRVFLGIVNGITELIRGIKAVGKNLVHGFKPRIGID